MPELGQASCQEQPRWQDPTPLILQPPCRVCSSRKLRPGARVKRKDSGGRGTGASHPACPTPASERKLFLHPSKLPLIPFFHGLFQSPSAALSACYSVARPGLAGTALPAVRGKLRQRQSVWVTQPAACLPSSAGDQGQDGAFLRRVLAPASPRSPGENAGST